MASYRQGLREIAEEIGNRLEYLRLIGVNDVLKEAVDACASCPLKDMRDRAVKGEGRAGARVLILEGGPGVGSGGVGGAGGAGELLSNMLKAFARELGDEKPLNEDFYLTHAVKCPSEEKGVDDSSISACRAKLDEEIAAVSPQVIVAFGPIAALSTLGKQDVPSLRGRFHSYKGVPLMVTYDPGTLNARQALKKDAWEDIKKVAAFLKEKGPGKGK